MAAFAAATLPNNQMCGLRHMTHVSTLSKGITTMQNKLLSFTLYAGSAILGLIALGHFLGIKSPIFFIYFNTPYLRYQDILIGSGILSQSLFFFAAARNKSLTPYVLVSIWTVIGCFFWINTSGTFQQLLIDGQQGNDIWRLAWSSADQGQDLSLNLTTYWLQIIPITAYGVALTAVFLLHLKGKNKSREDALNAPTL